MVESDRLEDRLLGDLLLIATVERQVATQQQEDNHAHRPAVNCLLIRLLEENLGSDVAQRAVRFASSLTGAERAGQAEIDQFDVGVFALVD